MDRTTLEQGIREGGRAPRYVGEDTSPTTPKELRGFYVYGLAAEVFAVCGVGTFLPVTLEQLARERGVLYSDRSVSCVAKAVAGNGPAVAARLLQRATGDDNDQCLVRIFNKEITTSSFAMYTSSLAVFVQAIALVSVSAVADYGTYRKRLLLGFGFTGAISSMLFLLVMPANFLLGPFLVVIGVTCLGSSFVILNSFLPLLVSNHALVHTRESSHLGAIPMEVLPSSVGEQEHHIRQPVNLNIDDSSDSLELKLSTEISSRGIGIGYMAAVFVQILSILLLFIMSKTTVSSTLPLRMALFMVGLWWFVFTVPVSFWLRDRPGPPLKISHPQISRWRSCLATLSFSWVSVWKTIKVAAKLRQVVIFLAAWFLLSDAVATVSGTAVLFARTELGMGTVAISILSITATSSGITGAFIWPLLSRRYGFKINHTIVFCILLMEIIPCYGLLGYVPFIKSWGVGGLQKSWEIYPLGFIHGFIMGGLNSYCRALFGLLIPQGSEAAFYALYAITDKGSSAVGPTVVGLIVDSTGTIRPAFIFLAVMVALPAPLIWIIDVEKGQEQAIKVAGTMMTLGTVEEIEGEAERFQETEGLMNDHD